MLIMFVNNLHVSKRSAVFLQQFFSFRKQSASAVPDSKIENELLNNQEHESHSENISGPLYRDHIPTSFLQKALLTIGSSVLCITDPFRHDMIAVFGETTGYASAKQIREKMLNDPEGSTILNDKPRINSNTLDYKFLATLPHGTLGQAYLAFLKDNNVTPDSRRQVHFVDDPDLAYVIQRYREVHDLNHTLLGMPTNMLGEVAVKWIEAMQLGLPMCVSAALLGPVRLRKKQREKYLKYYLPWAVNCGYEAKFLMNVYFEKRWEQDVYELRRELNIPDFPVEC
ncbi:ubiquinone biosynthesis protein COQ4 homolog, mitochondrial [Trichonephila inaurata madagascariensis]|uniref:Ubiquinone biosynthesis protein COQ4 homolog, mitochondrial n=1 Tax=Trichonephila inaurata madagascariensis TaxID=2747483 RepID=A0A8X6YF85_9ARAC|nr:ubiquinone biosynthesis protein COQ4 homolog, mitochondrial [Trichonephila inaurata madagascariensis]